VPIGWFRLDPFAERLWGIDDPAIVRSMARMCVVRAFSPLRTAVFLIVLFCAIAAGVQILERLLSLGGWRLKLVECLSLATFVVLLIRSRIRRALRELPAVLRALGAAQSVGMSYRIRQRDLPESGPRHQREQVRQPRDLREWLLGYDFVGPGTPRGNRPPG
jgi:hypothetical protein